MWCTENSVTPQQGRVQHHRIECTRSDGVAATSNSNRATLDMVLDNAPCSAFHFDGHFSVIFNHAGPDPPTPGDPTGNIRLCSSPKEGYGSISGGASRRHDRRWVWLAAWTPRGSDRAWAGRERRIGGADRDRVQGETGEKRREKHWRPLFSSAALTHGKKIVWTSLRLFSVCYGLWLHLLCLEMRIAGQLM